MPDLPSLRPQSALLIFLGDHVIGRGVCVSSASLVAVLSAMGVGEQAARATLTRMVRRGLLHRVSVGRHAYFGPTPRGEVLIRDGVRRGRDEDVVPLMWDGTWTMVTFSMPDSFQRQRHDLRNRLTWAGFGSLQNGVWVAPRAVDVSTLTADLDVARHLRVFEGRPLAPTGDAAIVAEAYDLTALARGYRAYLRRWARGGPRALGGPLPRRTILSAEWLRASRDDPRLPAPLLPADWPGQEAQDLYRSLSLGLSDGAEAALAELLETVPAP